MALFPNAAFCRSDVRYAALEACARALFPGAVLVPVYDEAHHKAAEVTGSIPADAVPNRIELRFMPPPGLSFDSRHPFLGVMSLEDAVRDIRSGIIARAQLEESECLAPPCVERSEHARAVSAPLV